jgi:hypothetical protein
VAARRFAAARQAFPAPRLPGFRFRTIPAVASRGNAAGLLPGSDFRRSVAVSSQSFLRVLSFQLRFQVSGFKFQVQGKPLPPFVRFLCLVFHSALAILHSAFPGWFFTPHL